MKTPMQMLIEKLSDFKKELSDKYDSDPYVTKGVSIAIGEANKLLEEEKRQIMDAWNDGFYGLEAPETQSAEQYYNQTYNNENDTTDTTAKGL